MFRKNDKIIVLLAFLMGSFVYANAAVPEPVEELKISTLEPIYFLKNRSVVIPKSASMLDQIILLLQAHPEWEIIEIEGYTDASEKGSSRKLSKQRAEMVQTFLIQHGINASRLKVMHYGSTEPKSKVRTEEGRAKNRRVEFTIGQVAKTLPTLPPQ